MSYCFQFFVSMQTVELDAALMQRYLYSESLRGALALSRHELSEWLKKLVPCLSK
jgi:hypothetical protein